MLSLPGRQECLPHRGEKSSQLRIDFAPYGADFAAAAMSDVSTMEIAMKSLFTVFVLGFAVAIAQADEPAARVVTTGALLDEMKDLATLARWPTPAYRNVQFSSYDRRSTTPEAPGWFSNADGFGGEPIPGFLKTLREPAGGKPGLYLVADVRGPGAIVRGWSAGMEGILRVYLDPKAEGGSATDGTLIYEGPAYGFLARRSAHFLKIAGIDIDAKNAFIQTRRRLSSHPVRARPEGHLGRKSERTPLLPSPGPRVCGRDRRPHVRSEEGSEGIRDAASRRRRRPYAADRGDEEDGKAACG